jgi:hypothetical protein
VFKLSPPIPPATKWTETVLYSFKGDNDGASPQGSLLADSKGISWDHIEWRRMHPRGRMRRRVQALAKRDRDGAARLLQ